MSRYISLMSSCNRRYYLVDIRADLGRIILRVGAHPRRFITYKAVLSALIPKELAREN